MTLTYTYYMSLQCRNKSKSVLTSPSPAQAASCCVISGTNSIYTDNNFALEKCGAVRNDKTIYAILGQNAVIKKIYWRLCTDIDDSSCIYDIL
jgi:hypothetical protein